jgi:LuxR family maltose regulon positive regulatory protein
MLLLLERANLFVVPLDEERRWYRLHELFREALLSALHTTHPELAPVLHRRAADYYEAQGEWYEAITHRLATADFSAAARLMEQTVEQFWLHGEAATMARWITMLPQPLVREHARLVLTTALYLLNTVEHTTQEQRARVHKEVRRLMVRVETALRPQVDELSPEVKATRADAAEGPKCLESLAAEEALLHRRLHLLRVGLAWYEAFATQEYERLNALQQEIQKLDQDEEVIWQMLPLSWSFVLHYTVRQEGARLLPQLLEAKRWVSQSESHFAIIRVRQWLAMAAVEAGHLHLAYEESQAALALIEQMKGFVLLKGYFEVVQIQVLYRWNRLEEARELLYTVVRDAAAYQQLDLLGIAYFYLMRVELAAGELAAAEQARREAEQLVLHEQYGAHPILFPPMRVQLSLAQGQIREASDWAAGIAFPEGSWEFGLYEAFPVVIRVYFAQRRFREALSLLERWSEHLDRLANIGITLTYLAQYLVALHQGGQSEQARVVAARLFALTEPRGYLRVYLDEGELMQEALSALLEVPYEMGSALPEISLSYLSALLQVFEHEDHKSAMRAEASLSRTEEASVLPAQSVSSASSRSSSSLSRQERRVLRLLVAGRTYTEMAKELIVSLNTVKTQVSSIYRKLGVSRRAEAIAEASRLHLL